MEVRQIVNPVFSSNTYIIYKTEPPHVWLIDTGDMEGALATLGEKARSNDRILLTDNTYLIVPDTPGHTPGRVAFKVAHHLFPGGSFIPTVKVVT